MSALDSRRDPLSDAASSLLLPGLGQYLQHRRRAALHFAIETVALLAGAAFVPHLRAVAWRALAAVTLWSAADAARGAMGGSRAPAV